MTPSGPTPNAVCGLVITYFPDPSLLNNLKLLCAQAAEVLVVDNGSEEASADLLLRAEKELGIRVIRNQRNLGIAAALNIGIKYVITAGYRWVATFDQDSTVTPGFFEAMLAAYEACGFRGKVPLIAPVLCISGEEAEHLGKTKSAGKYSLTRTAMTSGSLIKTEVFEQAGFYDEGFFMDYVDYDFCLRLWRRGWRLIRAERAFLVHRLGLAEAHSFLGFRVTTKSHSAWRRYYIMRNRVIIFKRYAFSSPLWCLHDFFWIFLELTKIILLEQEKGSKFRNMLRGFADGLAGKTGTIAI